MVIILNAYFNVRPELLTQFGVLNAHLGIDNLLFVDPNLLKTTKAPELKGARAELEKYFVPVITLVKASNEPGDIAWKAAIQRLTFKEEHGTALGYASAGKSGRGIGAELAETLVQRAKEIVNLNIEAPEMFELIGLFQENFGPDLLSDMAVSILKERFLAYTQRVTKALELKPSRTFPVRQKEWLLPVHPDGKKALIFVPFDVLSPLPIALDRSEIDEVAHFNAEVRQKWNEIVAAAGKEGKDPSKAEIREMLLAKPQNLADLIEVYRKAAGNGYNFNTDPQGLLSWEYFGRTAAEKSPLEIQNKKPQDMGNLREVLDLIVAQFKKLVEQNKLYEVLYDDNGRARREEFSQRVFFAVADTYCKANNVDLNREPNAGNGPVDFKLSAGYNGRFLVELKKSTNSRLLHGFETQLPEYEKSEATHESLYLIMRVSEGEAGIKDVIALRERKIKQGAKVPRVIVIDARKKASASKLKGKQD
jgi:hypothetical protein